jgi:hypothetical protein
MALTAQPCTGTQAQTKRRCKEVPVRSTSAVGIDGHHWNLHHAPGARLPCRALCECGWISTAGQRIQVLLELKGHLEQALSNDARPSRQDADMPTHWESAERPGRLGRRPQAGGER